MGSNSHSHLEVWRSLEAELPGLAAMARDILCIPMAGVGVDRAFSFARNHLAFNQGQLQPLTIRITFLVYWTLIEEQSKTSSEKKLSQVLDKSRRAEAADHVRERSSRDISKLETHLI
jgi:hAT family C-terminal dimerisation region